ncbi:cryptochrome/photolyase family protein [Lacisediminimonas profundi]|uniref:cryptochrome/photolyase family protein n=1 Tax=Lacisediminimonas profundi TaxID=2603856 RepID=UPI00124B151D|nr:deoxyribodipyrimidine photo-lyase [Lacisediminimonas profundi]
MPRFDTSLVWFRRDLRNFDHAALHFALQNSRAVYCVFVFDREILAPLLERGLRADRRVEFIFDSVQELAAELRACGGGLLVRHSVARDEIPRLAKDLRVDAVLVNSDYEPAAVARDAAVEQALRAQGRQMLSFKDQVIFEKDELLSQSGRPYAVFTPYKNAWLKKLLPDAAVPAAEIPALGAWMHDVPQSALAAPPPGDAQISLEDLGFERTNLRQLGIPTGMSGGSKLIEDFLPRLARYDTTRDYPSIKGPSYLSVHLRFGTVSIRGLVRMALDAMRSGEGGDGARVWLSELVWRDFYFMILHNFPHVVDHSFRPEFDRVEWEAGTQADEDFSAWCEGRTGYPLVDAAMLQLNQTGYMHNRLRMVTASFLVKDLGIDWRRGEHYFAERLNDYDLAANNGGWQWAASTGCDAQPWFRIFNPVTQSERFDTEGKFIRRYLPVLGRLSAKQIHAPWLAPAESLADAGVRLGVNYPRPVVAHDEARKRTLERFSVVKKASPESPV